VQLSDDISDKWIRFDEFEDAVLALELVALLSKDVRAHPSYWKWIIIAMQNAVQGAMALSLMGTDGCGALTSNSRQKNREWLSNPQGDRPQRVMAPYKELLGRVQNSQFVNGPPLVLPEEDLRNLERLNELRREFAHFNPKAWGIQLRYMLDIMPVALTTVEFLLGKQASAVRHLTEDQSSRIAKSIATACDSFAGK
jgi:hypothetical protein